MFCAWGIGMSPMHWQGGKGLGVVGAFGSMVVVTGGSLQDGQGVGGSNPITPAPRSFLHCSLNSFSEVSPKKKR